MMGDASFVTYFTMDSVKLDALSDGSFVSYFLKCYYRPTASLQLNNKGNTKYNITVT